MNINRNYIFLEIFSLTLIGAFLLNVLEFVARLITDHPNDYLVILTIYIVVFVIVVFGFYKLTYKPPKYDKIVHEARKKENSLIDGLKTKIDTIDQKQSKKKEKFKKETQPVIAKLHSQSTKKLQNTSSKQISNSKSKNVRRRR